jgi:hypothetical protein
MRMTQRAQCLLISIEVSLLMWFAAICLVLWLIEKYAS